MSALVHASESSPDIAGVEPRLTAAVAGGRAAGVPADHRRSGHDRPSGKASPNIRPRVQAAVELYGRGLEGAEDELLLRDDRGSVRPLALGRWLGAATAADDDVLARAVEPVLDVGCGPGRHVLALARRGRLAIGIDISPVAVRVARARGAMVVEGSVFDRVPGAGKWGSALLLDGNIGIGGRPAALLRRVAALLTPGGQVLVELEPAGRGSSGTRARIEAPGGVSQWFAWSSVEATAIAAVASDARLRLTDQWEVQGRWFACLAAR